MLVRADLRHPLSLRNLLPDAEFLGADDIAMTACSCDPRQVRPGTVFVVLPGLSHRERLSEAIARGCSGIVAEQGVYGAGVPICYVRHSGEAYGRICQAMAGDPSRRLKIIGLTGSGGTTTTCCLVASILTTAGHKVGILGALGCFDGREVTRIRYPTPPAHELARWLARMVDRGCAHAVVEVSRRALIEGWVGGVVFDAACVVNQVSLNDSGRDPSLRAGPCRPGLYGAVPHSQGTAGPTRPGSEFPESCKSIQQRNSRRADHRSIRDRQLGKSRLVEHLDAEGFAIVNADDPVALSHLHLHDGPVLTVGIESEAEITAALVEQCPSEQTILLSAGSEAMPVRTRMIGIPHVYHCLTAAAVGLAYGIDLPTVVRGLEAIDYVPGRLERIECGQPFSVFIDCAHTPEALSARLETLRDVVRGRLICVFGARGERHQGRRPLLGQAVENAADLAVITDDNPRGEDPQAIIEDILGGLKCPAEAEVIPDRAEAIAWALSQARPSDVVLIAGKGHQTQHIAGGQRCYFDDRQVARQWLYANSCGHE